MKKIHNNLLRKSHIYASWHKNPHHSLVHGILLFAFISILSVYSFQAMTGKVIGKGSPPVVCIIDSFTANPATVVVGGNTTIGWETTGCLGPMIMEVIDPSGFGVAAYFDLKSDGSLVYQNLYYGTNGEWTFEIRDESTSVKDKITVKIIQDYPLLLMGGSTEVASNFYQNDIWESTNGEDWANAVNNVVWGPRDNFTTVYFNNKYWVLGGRASNGYKNDVWSSSDGSNWNLVTANAPWSGRWRHTSVVFNNKIWVIGGTSSGSADSIKKDVWASSDGVNWTLVTSNAAWALPPAPGFSPTGRYFHTSVVFNNKIWVIGGENISAAVDVWSSPDGINWTKTADVFGWTGGKSKHTSVVFNDKIWVIGGAANLSNDIWSSPDGINWTKVVASQPWGPRFEQSAHVYKNKIWVTGGKNWSGNSNGTLFNDVWSSPDGINWTPVTSYPGWAKRHNHQIISQ